MKKVGSKVYSCKKNEEEAKRHPGSEQQQVEVSGLSSFDEFSVLEISSVSV